MCYESRRKVPASLILAFTGVKHEAARWQRGGASFLFVLSFACSFYTFMHIYIYVYPEKYVHIYVYCVWKKI